MAANRLTEAQAKLSALSRAFDPLFVPGDDGRFYVETVHHAFRQQLEVSLAFNPNSKLLVAGQPGCGKTTLLTRIAAHLREAGRQVAFVNLELVAAVQDLSLLELHLATLAELLTEVDALAPDLVADVGVWLASFGRHQVGQGGSKALAEALTRLLSLSRDDPSVRREMREMVRSNAAMDPLRLLHRLLRELEPRLPVVILDGLDKMPPEQARVFFLESSNKPLADGPGAAVLTMPLSIVYEAQFNQLRERYLNADNAIVPAVKIYTFDGVRTRNEQGYEVLRQIVEARVAPDVADLLEDDAINRAIEASGGNIRELARIIHASVIKTVIRGAHRVETIDVEAVIIDQRESYRRAFKERFLPALRRVRDKFELENEDDVGKDLLYGLWVVEYRNERAWYSLPVAVEKLIGQIEKGRR